MKRPLFYGAVLLLLVLARADVVASANAAGFKAGIARRDITPEEPVPMWGYGARHDLLSAGVLDPLQATALVLEAGSRKLAIVGLDLGRSPSESSLGRIRSRLKEAAQIEHSLIGGSHTHHGPVLELSDTEGKGKGRFDAALRYYGKLEQAIVEAVCEADAKRVAVRMAAGSVELAECNRNRHSKSEAKPVDRQLGVWRFEGEDGKPLALLVSFAAHPTMVPGEELKFSADYVGAMRKAVESETGAMMVFMQGAAGDLSANGGGQGYLEFGRSLGIEVVKLAKALKPMEVEHPSLTVHEERFRFSSRTDWSSPMVRLAYGVAFFPELIANYLDEYADGIRPRMTVALVNGQIGLAGVSGEFFCQHAIRLRERARLPNLFFFGYCNGYHQYFPTIEATAEGGYGADEKVSPVAIGAGETIMNEALIRFFQMRQALK